LIGRLSLETKITDDGRTVPAWEIINLPAIREDGTPLWHRRPLSFLEQHRANDYDWWSLWMGHPRPRGSSVFRGVKFYDELPKRYRIGKGVDLAYTAKTHADWSVGIVLVRGEDEHGHPLYFVVDVQREQSDVPTFATRLEACDIRWPGAWHWFCSTTEKGVAQLVTARGVHVDPVLATADKFVRAQPVATAWNEGRVLVPRNAPWLKSFVDEIGLFTGVGDRRDDQVDALASAFTSCSQISDPPRTRDRGNHRYADMGGYGRG
jgi:predicted phage terminase large subunit-like protein